MLDFLGSLNPHLAVLLASLIPVLESQAAVPLGVLAYHLPLPVVLFWCLVASAIIPICVLPVIHFFVGLLKKINPRVQIFVEGFLDSRMRQHSASFERWGSFALALFIAIPGPFTGAWTATILAYIFGIKFWHAVISIMAGSLAAAGIIAILVASGRQLLG